MANVLHRITKQYIKSVNTPDYPELEWIINPILPNCNPIEWVVVGDLVRETTKDEKDAKIAEALNEEEIKLAQEIEDKANSDAAKIEAKGVFDSLSIDDKIEYLYNNHM